MVRLEAVQPLARIVRTSAFTPSPSRITVASGPDPAQPRLRALPQPGFSAHPVSCQADRLETPSRDTWLGLDAPATKSRLHKSVRPHAYPPLERLGTSAACLAGLPTSGLMSEPE